MSFSVQTGTPSECKGPLLITRDHRYRLRLRGSQHTRPPYSHHSATTRSTRVAFSTALWPWQNSCARRVGASSHSPAGCGALESPDSASVLSFPK